MKQVPAASSLFLQLLKASLWVLHEPPCSGVNGDVCSAVTGGAGSSALAAGELMVCPGGTTFPSAPEQPVLCGDSQRAFPC